MANVTFPRNGIPIGFVTVNGQRLAVDIHPEYLRAFNSILGRVGGVTGTGTNDLALSQFEDAGIEETKANLYRLTDDVFQLPPMVVLPADDENQLPPVVSLPIQDDPVTGIEELRAQVAELTKAIQALQQGLTA